MSSAIERERTRFLDGHRDRHARRPGYGFQGQVTAGDSSDKQGKMGAKHKDLRRKKKQQQCKLGREKEGSSSNRPELAAFLLALCNTLIEEPLLYLCDNQSLLKAVNRWIVEGGKATLVGAPDADILATAIEILRKRIATGKATFLVKVKAALRGEPANEGADILVDMMMIAFSIFNSSLVPMIDGLCTPNPWEFELCGFRRNQTEGYFRFEGRQRVVPTDESSSLHVEKTVPRGRESNLSRSSFDI